MEFSPEEIKAVLQSKEGRQLIRLLQADGGKALSQASAAFKSGDTAKAISLLQPMVDSPTSAQLIQEINKKIG